MKKALKIFAIAIAAVSVGACTTFQLSGVSVVSDMPGVEVVGDFSTTVAVTEWLGASGGANLFNVTADAMDSAIYDAIQREVAQMSGDAAIDVDIRYEATFINLLLNQLTGTIYSPATAFISGTVVRYN